MNQAAELLNTLLHLKERSDIQVETFGQFNVHRHGELIQPKEWGRDKTTQLFQFFITARNRRALPKEQIADRIWEDVAGKSVDQTFKVALHGINKNLEPDRKKRTDPKYIIRQGMTYQLNRDNMWLDVDAFEQLVKLGNEQLTEDETLAKEAYKTAIEYYKGIYLPSRVYEDWSSAERERLQLLALGTMITFAELLIEQNPLESIRLSQQALQIDAAWEDAYRVQMEAYFKKGNRPMAIKTYHQCIEVLDEEFGIEPLPETKQLHQQIKNA